MTRYTVEIAEVAFASLRAHARHIAVECEAPVNAARWLRQVLRAIDSLEESPLRSPLALESAIVPYEVRQLVIGDYLAIFHVDESARTVGVLNFRHGSRRPRQADVPHHPKP